MAPTVVRLFEGMFQEGWGGVRGRQREIGVVVCCDIMLRGRAVSAGTLMMPGKHSANG